MTKSLAAVLAAFSLATPPALALAANRAVVEFSTCAKPEWPKESLRNSEQGTVQLAFLIGADGGVHDTRVERSSGHPLLDQAAREGLARCTFKPAQENGKPVESWTRMQYVWTLEDPTPQQIEASRAALRVAAERGEAASQYSLAVMLRMDHQEVQALSWLRKSAAEDFAAAESMLGVMLLNGGQAGDVPEAVTLLGKAAEQNERTAQVALADCYENGRGVAQDYAQAAKWYQRAAQANSRNALISLARLYDNGQGVPKDSAKAQALLEQAVAQR
ncbi:TonB family protein [Duganella sp. 1224]|uniref:TonB family protein n=1 Tax=Duganella sp. 1224 TaxID=2587052 RepID=UPI0015CBB24C|nr:TonB family protein [Duganella sp. 1224]NYE59144.1 TonB family protein [Duganella sp. 1224]